MWLAKQKAFVQKQQTLPAGQSLQPGELLLCSAGGASIKLCNDGRILMNGKETG